MAKKCAKLTASTDPADAEDDNNAVPPDEAQKSDTTEPSRPARSALKSSMAHHAACLEEKYGDLTSQESLGTSIRVAHYPPIPLPFGVDDVYVESHEPLAVRNGDWQGHDLGQTKSTFYFAKGMP